ncbi:hypothetical protein ACFPM1_07710 [Halorubrum rubrum]|uniref:Uncharacterized protein n=1 Tax=Halorubrum rubrum TaxID=1126240 RepID=A0ABD5R188_9EURY|nr:hypothetical protein [Halorubrum rubrum]
MPDPDLDGEVDLKTVVQQHMATSNDTGFALDAYRVLAPDDGEFVEPVLGIAVEFPNGGVYADWNVNAWPEGERLRYPHVSIYGSLEDFRQVSEGTIEHIDSVDAAKSGDPR